MLGVPANVSNKLVKHISTPGGLYAMSIITRLVSEL